MQMFVLTLCDVYSYDWQLRQSQSVNAKSSARPRTLLCGGVSRHTMIGVLKQLFGVLILCSLLCLLTASILVMLTRPQQSNTLHASCIYIRVLVRVVFEACVLHV